MPVFTHLVLTRDDYEYLIRKLPGHSREGVLIFQFQLNLNASPIDLNLCAYIMRRGHQAIPGGDAQDLQKQLSKTIPPDIPRPLPNIIQPTIDNIVIGDMQTDTSEFDRLIRESNPDPDDLEYFLFTPLYNSTIKRVEYEIIGVPATNELLVAFAKANPCPPASAS